MNLEKITLEARDLVIKTAGFIQEQAGRFTESDIEEKGNHNFVTYVDRESESRLVEGLKFILPEAGFIAEEGNYGDDRPELQWVIDPLDGTTNFVHRIPVFSISVALIRDQQVIAGIVHEVNRKESYYSWKGGEVFLNGQKIRVSKASLLKDSLLATGFPYLEEGKLAEYLRIFHDFTESSRGLRRLGSAAADLAYVACGRFEGFYEYGLNPWDVAAGTFLVSQAGGKVSDLRGGNDFLFGKEVIASNGMIHQDMLEIIRRHFG